MSKAIWDHKQLMLNNWDLVLKYTEAGCTDYKCGGCPFGISRSGSCVLIIHRGKSNKAIESEIKEICRQFVSEHLYGILSSDDK